MIQLSVFIFFMMGGYFELKQTILFNHGEVVTAITNFGHAGSIDHSCNRCALLKKVV